MIVPSCPHQGVRIEDSVWKWCSGCKYVSTGEDKHWSASILLLAKPDVVIPQGMDLVTRGKV